MQAFDAMDARQKVKDTFALKRQLREMQRLGMPLPRGARQVLHSGEQAAARPNTCPASTARSPIHAAMTIMPLHTGAWVRDDFAASVPVLDLGKAAPKQKQPRDQWRPSVRDASVGQAEFVPEFLLSTATEHVAGGQASKQERAAVTWRTTSSLVSGIPLAMSYNAAMMAVDPITSIQSNVGHDRVQKGDEASAADTQLPCHQLQPCHPHTGAPFACLIDEEGPEKHTAAYTAAYSEAARTCVTLERDGRARELDDQAIGPLDEESQKLAAVSKGLLKRAADLLGQAEDFQQAVGQAAGQPPDSEKFHVSHTGVGATSSTGIPKQHELTQEENGLLQDLMAAL